jgi:hypothetical protein
LALPIRFFKIVFIYIYLRSGGKAALRMSAPTINIPTSYF